LYCWCKPLTNNFFFLHLFFIFTFRKQYKNITNEFMIVVLYFKSLWWFLFFYQIFVLKIVILFILNDMTWNMIW
jgi:hypothetical protein